jgi:uncharacterized hydrophobic protein (TIGR00271 family)
MMFFKRLLVRFRLKKEKEDFETVDSNIENGIAFRGTNLWILIFAIFIASLGLNVNSTAVIIGAMLISPLMGPIMGMGYSLAVNDLSMLRRSWSSYLYATTVSLVTSTVYFTISPLNEAHSEILARTSPNIYDVLIALFGGLAGMLATTSRLKGNVIPGVAIATALMPPLCTAGYGIASMEPAYFFGAIYLFLINSVFIALATLLTSRLLKIPYKHLPDERAEKRAKRAILIITIVTVLPSIYFGYDLVVQNRQLKQANEFIQKETAMPNDYLLKQEIDTDSKTISLVYGGADMSDEQKQELEDKLKDYGLKDYQLNIRQGFSSLLGKSEVESGQMAMAIRESEREIQFLRSRVDSLTGRNDLSQQLFLELKTQYPDLNSLSVNKAVTVSDSTAYDFWMAVIDLPSAHQDAPMQQRINNWLKARLETDSIRVVY